MKSLVQIFEDQGNTTDKLRAHPYAHYYEELFKSIRNSTKSVLEIGIAQGGSIRAWEEYFPKATIYALDIENRFVKALPDGQWGRVELIGAGVNKCECGEFQLEDERHWHPSRIQASTVDVSDHDAMWDWVVGKNFDVIIDDGSHLARDISKAFHVLWQYVNPGGLYIVEDVAQSRTVPEIVSYFYQLQRKIMSNEFSAEAITYRPNMILLRKKKENDITCPPMNRL